MIGSKALLKAIILELFDDFKLFLFNLDFLFSFWLTSNFIVFLDLSLFLGGLSLLSDITFFLFSCFAISCNLLIFGTFFNIIIFILLIPHFIKINICVIQNKKFAAAK